MRKPLIVLAAVTVCALSFSATAIADDPATVTRATLASGITDSTGFYPATCDETQVISSHQRKETFNCTFDAAIPAPFVCDTSVDCFWFSDFDGAEATSTHFVITRSGLVVGWATY